MPSKQNAKKESNEGFKCCSYPVFAKTAYDMNGGSKGSKKYSEFLKECPPLYQKYKEDHMNGGASSVWDWLLGFINNMNLKTGLTKPPPGLSIHK